MKKLTALAILIFTGIISVAQSPGMITGKISGDDNKPVVSATVILLRAKDSSLVKTAVTNSSGVFVMTLVNPGTYFISATSIAHIKNSSEKFTVAEGQQFILAPLILLKGTTSLSRITVQAKKPMIEVKADRTVFNVENSINATGSNAFELLQKSPGVSVDKDDNISMQGKNGVKIYIDGKPTQINGAELAAFLRSVNSADIESIEMLANPSAKFDAAGNAGIINIRLIKNKNYGANGNLSSGVAFGHTPKYDNSVSLNYRNQKINIFSNYSNYYGTRQNLFNFYRVQNDTIYDQHSINTNNNKTNNIKAGLDYYLDSKNVIGVMITTNFTSTTLNTNSNTVITPVNTGIPNKILFATNNLPGSRNNLDYDLNYHYADTTGKELDVDADIVNFRRDGTSFQPNYYKTPFTYMLLNEKIYRNNTPTDINIYTARIDYEQPFYKGKLGFGGKITDVSTKNTFDFFNVYGSMVVKDEDLSNRFNYDENVRALYVNYNRPLSEKLTIQGGLRMENTKSEGDLISYIPQPEDTVKRNYTDFFPGGAVSYVLNKNNSFNLSYSRRIDRPGYQDLNPFEIKLDELTYRKGNAFLKPQYTNSFQLSHTFQSKYVTSLSFSHIKDFFAQIIDTMQNKSFITQKNLAQQNIFSLDISAPFTITKWWDVFATFNAYHSQYLADFGAGKKINANVDAYSIFAQQTLSIKKGPSFEISAFYYSPTIWGGTFKSIALGSIDIGLQQKFLKDAGTIKLSFTDLLNSLAWKGVSDYGGTHVEARGHFESQQLKINVSYRFGKKLVKAARQRKISDDEKKRLSNSGGIGNQ